METRNCPRCGKLFVYINRKICDDCYKEEEEKFLELKEFLDDNPNSSISEVSKETGVSVKKILGYIKEGRILVSEGLKGELKCGRCGVKINAGKFCDSCIIEINNEVSDLFSEKKPGIKMHTSTYSRKQ